jgi:hypothetical protein
MTALERRHANHKRARTGQPAPTRPGSKALKGSVPDAAAGLTQWVRPRTGRLDAATDGSTSADDGLRAMSSGGWLDAMPQALVRKNPRRADADERRLRGGRGCRLARRATGPGSTTPGKRPGVVRSGARNSFGGLVRGTGQAISTEFARTDSSSRCGCPYSPNDPGTGLTSHEECAEPESAKAHDRI